MEKALPVTHDDGQSWATAHSDTLGTARAPLALGYPTGISAAATGSVWFTEAYHGQATVPVYELSVRPGTAASVSVLRSVRPKGAPYFDPHPPVLLARGRIILPVVRIAGANAGRRQLSVRLYVSGDAGAHWHLRWVVGYPIAGGQSDARGTYARWDDRWSGCPVRRR